MAFDKFFNEIADRVASRVIDGMSDKSISVARAYRQGAQRKTLNVKQGQFDDNLALNYTGLVASRIVSQMFGQGIELDFEGDSETPQEVYIDAVLDANHEEILFHRASLSATEAGTGYLMIYPTGARGEDGVDYPRIQLIDPQFVTMDSLPEDYEMVIRYTIQYKFVQDGKEKARKRVIQHVAPDVAYDGTQSGGDTWEILDYISDNAYGSNWQHVGTTVWPFDFPPIIHWQNLPSVASCYGEPDISTPIIAMQDRINFVSSNISKLIRYYAHPMRIAKNVGTIERVDMGPDQMVKISGADADISQLDPLGDLIASLEYFKILRQTFFDTARVVDIDSLEDKLGTLTNFALRVIYQDNLAMIGTKRELFGDMLEELIRRLLILANMQPVPCEVVWPDFLPMNGTEQVATIKTELELGVISKQSAASELGIDWEQEQERINQEAQDANANSDNIGAAILRAFNNGGTQQQQPQMMNQNGNNA
jgi:hypothetical protein